MARVRRDYRKAWAASVFIDQAPAVIQPPPSFWRELSTRFPEIVVRFTPERQCVTLWEKTRAGDLVVIQDLPKGQPLDRRVIDHLALCDIARHPGVQAVIDAVDAQAEKVAAEVAYESRRRNAPDTERVLWAARKDLSEATGMPLGVRVQVPA